MKKNYKTNRIREMLKPLATLFLFMALLFGTQVSFGTNWYVDPSGTNDGSHGTSTGTDAFLTIQYAVSYASVVNGDVIIVGDGNYAGNVTISKNITLKSVNGAAYTTITGSYSGGGQGTIYLPSGRDGVTVGAIGQGFTIIGYDDPSIDRAAIYFQATQANITIEGNIITANGEGAMLGEYNADLNNIIINANVINGTTLLGTYSGSNKWDNLVFFGGVTGTTNTRNFTFTNNVISGTAGSGFYGNDLVTLDCSGTNIITGNIFSGTTTSSYEALRMRGNGTYMITNNSFTGSYGKFINRSGTVVDSYCNWWGSILPSSSKFSNVNYKPWLTSGTDADANTPGFQTTETCLGPCNLVIATSSTNQCTPSVNGSVSVLVTSGGLGSYTYVWKKGATTIGGNNPSVTGLAAATNYSVTVTDINGCSASASGITISVYSSPTATAYATQAACPTFDNGTATVTPVGGSGTYSYLWSPGGQTTAIATGLVANSYSVTVTDLTGGCTATANATLTNSTAGPVHNSNSGLNYCTIQAAINAATTQAGDVIEVSAGTYPEQISVTKSLTFKGNNVGISAGTVAGVRIAESIITGGFYVNTAAAGTVIDGFTIQNGYNNGSNQAGIVAGSTNLVIQNNIIKDCGGSQGNGIETTYSANSLVIRNNEIVNNWRGIYLNPSDGITIEGNAIHDNNVSGVGIGSDGQINLTLTGNKIYNQTEGWGFSNSTGLTSNGPVAHSNSFLSPVNNYSGNGTTWGGPNLQINATCNWWGDTDPSNDVSGDVNYTPYSISEGGACTGGGGPITAIPTLTDVCLNAITVPIKVSQFNNVGAITLVLNFDETKLQLTGITYNSLLIGDKNADITVANLNGALRFTFANSNTGVNLPDNSTLFDLTFSYLGTGCVAASIPLTWDNSDEVNLEYASPAGDVYIDDPFESFYINGSVALGHSAAPVIGVPDAESNVECAPVSAPTPPSGITDVCGNAITPTGPDVTGTYAPGNCEGTIIYTWTYTDCAGLSSTWKHTYNVDHVTLPVVPADGTSNVQCISAIVEPTPPTVTDVCGVAITPVLVVTDLPASFTCEGTRTFTYTYTDCSGLASEWKHTVTVDRVTPPVVPADGASTVECESAATAPAAPTGILDVCGNPISHGSVMKRILNTIDFSEAVTLSEIQAPGVWYTDRTKPFGFTSPVNFDGGDRLKLSINAADKLANDWANTSGRKYDLGTATDYAEIKLYISEDWETANKRMAGFWATAFDASNAVSAYPIVEFTSDGNNPRFRGYETGTGDWVDMGLPAGFAYNTWVTLKIRLLPSGEFLYSVGSKTYQTKTGATGASVRLGNVILQGKNTTDGVTYDIYWDDFMWNDVYTAALTCEGKIAYTYDFTDCSGLTTPWTYTYTIEHSTPPAEFGGPVSIASDIYNITAATPPALPVVQDVCGVVLTPSGPSIADNVVDCAGTYIYTYTYTDCAGLDFSWTYTYTLLKSTVSGNMKYYNIGKTPVSMGNVTLALNPGGYTCITSTDPSHVGEFSFPGLCAGEYTLTITNNNKDLGGINATDAVQINRWSANMLGPIEHVRFLAGDVTSDKWIDSSDPLRIQNFFSNPGGYSITPDWSYWKADPLNLIVDNEHPYDKDGITNPTWPTDIKIVVNGDVTDFNLYAMRTGDFNGSLSPDPTKSANLSLTLTENSNIQVGANQAFELPMRAASAMQVSAVSMILQVPANMVKVQDVVVNGSAAPVVWAVSGNEVRIAWQSLTPVHVGENGSLVTLKLMTTAAFTAGQSIDISLPYDVLDELADGNYEAMKNAALMVAKVGNQTVGITGVYENNGLKLSNYPNPFSKYTTVEYALPVDGKVTINLYNNVGQLVSVLVDANQNAGQYSIRMDSNNLNPGIYIAKLRLTNTNVNLTGTSKLSVLK